MPGQSSLWAERYRAARCSLPGADTKTSSLRSSEDDFAPAWPCSRRGLPGRSHYCARRWSLTPPFHHHPPSPHPLSYWERGAGVRGLSVSVALFRQVRAFRRSPPRMLSDVVLYGVRTFLDPDHAGPRLPDRPEAISS